MPAVVRHSRFSESGMRRVPLSAVLVLVGCVGGTSDLPLAIAPTQPIPVQPIIESLTPLSETTVIGSAGDKIVVQVKATIAGGTPASGAFVIFRVVNGGGVVQPVSVVTDPAGVAAATWTLGPQPATNLLSVVGGPASSITFTAVVQASPAQ